MNEPSVFAVLPRDYVDTFLVLIFYTFVILISQIFVCLPRNCYIQFRERDIDPDFHCVWWCGRTPAIKILFFFFKGFICISDMASLFHSVLSFQKAAVADVMLEDQAVAL